MPATTKAEPGSREVFARPAQPLAAFGRPPVFPGPDAAAP
jgi:hypothetical protein